MINQHPRKFDILTDHHTVAPAFLTEDDYNSHLDKWADEQAKAQQDSVHVLESYYRR